MIPFKVTNTVHVVLFYHTKNEEYILQKYKPEKDPLILQC